MQLNLPGKLLYGNQVIELRPLTIEEGQEFKSIHDNSNINKLIRLYRNRLNIDIFQLTKVDFEYVIKVDAFNMPDMKYSTKVVCPHCKEEQNILINISDFNVNDLNLDIKDNPEGLAEFDSDTGSIIQVKILRVEDLFVIQLLKNSDKLTEKEKGLLDLLFTVKFVNSEWLINLIKNRIELGKEIYTVSELNDIASITKEYYISIFKNFSLKDASTISLINDEIFKFGIDNILKLKCPSCSGEVELDTENSLVKILPFRDKSSGISRIRVSSIQQSRSNESRKDIISESKNNDKFMGERKGKQKQEDDKSSKRLELID